MENYIKLEQHNKNLILDQDRWVALGLDPNKGLLIMGPVGVGKTTLLNKYLENKNRGHWIEPAFIGRGLVTHGTEYFRQFEQDHFTLDDLGKESETFTHYGHTFFPGQDMIDIRHNVFTRTAGRNRTCFTTNLNQEGLKERYGERCYSRLTEMCNFIALVGEDFRVKKV